MTNRTEFWTRKLSNPFVPEGTREVAAWGLLSLGVLLGVLQAHLRYPLSIPGHHGIEIMALLLFGRLLSHDRYAATILMSAAATTYLVQAPFLALAHDMKPAVIYLLTGATADLLFLVTKDRLPILVNGALIGAVAFITKPVVMFVLLLAIGLPSGMFAKHPDYLPFLTHLLFGMTGGIIGALLARGVLKKRA